jgi:predicted GIY-YIG superfamily endonuclease
MKCVYIIRNADTEYYKIGYTKNLNKRLKQHETYYLPVVKYIFKQYKNINIRSLEKYFHAVFHSYKIKNEIFKLDDSGLFRLEYIYYHYNKFIEEERDVEHVIKVLHHFGRPGLVWWHNMYIEKKELEKVIIKGYL